MHGELFVQIDCWLSVINGGYNYGDLLRECSPHTKVGEKGLHSAESNATLEREEDALFGEVNLHDGNAICQRRTSTQYSISEFGWGLYFLKNGDGERISTNLSVFFFRNAVQIFTVGDLPSLALCIHFEVIQDLSIPLVNLVLVLLSIVQPASEDDWQYLQYFRIFTSAAHGEWFRNHGQQYKIQC